ncbi:hypothetical protein Fmac_003219 [Flemingia macrophylla]|uniref:Uncharacterized protein n=1 Tax=Flemingia macrophylla TaxID=520843 RepID=A0ABD1NM58_9FABA
MDDKLDFGRIFGLRVKILSPPILAYIITLAKNKKSSVNLDSGWMRSGLGISFGGEIGSKVNHSGSPAQEKIQRDQEILEHQHQEKTNQNGLISHYSQTNETQHVFYDQSKDSINLGHVAQWESARVEAEARGSMLQVGSGGSSHLARLFLSKIPTHQPLSSDSLSTEHRPMYNMYALVLATNHDLESSVSTLSVLKISTNIGQLIHRLEKLT